MLPKRNIYKVLQGKVQIFNVQICPYQHRFSVIYMHYQKVLPKNIPEDEYRSQHTSSVSPIFLMYDTAL